MIHRLFIEWAGKAPVKQLCRVLQASRSGYYTRRQRAQRPAQTCTQGLRATAAFEASGRTYVSSRLSAKLRAEGVDVDPRATRAALAGGIDQLIANSTDRRVRNDLTMTELIDVMGSDIPPALLISHIDRGFKMTASAQASEAAKPQAARGPNLPRQVMDSSFVSYAMELAEGVGYTMKETSGFFKTSKLEVLNKQGFFRAFHSPPELVARVRDDVCPQFLRT